MADYWDFLKKKEKENIEEDILSTYEGSVFWMRYMSNRAAFSKLQGKVLSAIRESGITVPEAIGFMQYMKYPIMRCSTLIAKKEVE